MLLFDCIFFTFNVDSTMLCCKRTKFGSLKPFYFGRVTVCLAFLSPQRHSLKSFWCASLVASHNNSSSSHTKSTNTKTTRVTHLTLSLSSKDASRQHQHPTGHRHLSKLSNPSNCNHGPLCHRRPPDAPFPSPRWEHVARWPHAPLKESWLLLVLCVKLLLAGDAGE